MQDDPTPFGPIHIQTGPSLAEVRGRRPGYLSTSLMAGGVIPLGNVGATMWGGLMLGSRVHYNIEVRWGAIGLGLSTGILSNSTNDSVHLLYDYELISIPVAFNLRYTTLSASPWFWSMDLSSGLMINVVYLLDGMGDPVDTLATTKLFFSPTLNIGRRFFDKWRASVYVSYLMILFDVNYFYGIAPGLQVEYEF